MAADFKYCVQADRAHSHGARASQGSAQGWRLLAGGRGSHPQWRTTLLVGDRPNKLLETLKACLRARQYVFVADFVTDARSPHLHMASVWALGAGSICAWSWYMRVKFIVEVPQ